MDFKEEVSSWASILLLLCCFVSSSHGTGVVCPTGTHLAEATCYTYNTNLKYSWSSANTRCQSSGYKLLKINSWSQFYTIKQMIQTHGYAFWIGANSFTYGNFRWLDGTNINSGYWLPGEPNDGDEHCVDFWKKGNKVGLNDENCGDKKGYMCEVEECKAIANCKTRTCSSAVNTVCNKCFDDNVYYMRTHANTKCERMCSFDSHKCWPGSCSNKLTLTCACATDFKLVKTSSETSCQLRKTPTINNCQTIVSGLKGEKKRTNAGKCHELDNIFGNFQPTSLKFSMTSDMKIDISKIIKPHFISESLFGVTDTRISIKRVKLSGIVEPISVLNQTTDTSHSTKANATVFNEDTITLNQTKYRLQNGERLCFQYEAFGGGYVKAFNFDKNLVTSPLSYKKTQSTEKVCFKYDIARPQHCSSLSFCTGLSAMSEPLTIRERVTRSPIIPLEFRGWTDPIPTGGKLEHSSGIESFEVRVNEVSDGIVDTSSIISKKLNSSEMFLILNLTSSSPKMYCVTLEVKDAADNVQQARRFVLYDNTTFISSRKDKNFLVTSASLQTNYTWQTHHKDICLNWKDHFYNKFYMNNNLLGRVKPDPNGLIIGIYEQESAPLPVSGTQNVFGITSYNFSWSLNDGPFSREKTVPQFLKQTYCHKSPFTDGQTYTLRIKAIDILNNTYTEDRIVHIDRSVPHINNIGLMSKGEKRLFVHDNTDLSKMNLIFDALDSHSGLHNIKWTFGITDSGQELGSGSIAVMEIGQETCPKHLSKCYCPDVGKCERYNYSIPLNKLVEKNTNKGNHNRNYYFTIKVTNKAMLSNVEQIDILVDDSPPEVGVVYEGAVGTSDIDYTSDNSFIVRWHGFIDHESGIKEYRLRLSDTFLQKEQLYKYEEHSNETQYMQILHTETSARVTANFTGKKYVCITAINNAMEASDVVCSDGIIRDINPPDLKNLKLKNGKWSESLYCHNGTAWLFHSDMRKQQLPDIYECNRRCTSDSPGPAIYEILSIENNIDNDTSLGEFICKHLPKFNVGNVIYLPNDHIYLSWDISENGSQIEDFYVGFGHTAGNNSALSIMDYKSTMREQHFKIRHLGIGAGNLFYTYIKTLNKANLEKVTVIGPILIDETPPHFNGIPIVKMENEMITIGWNNDTVYDPEQTSPINKIFFQIVHEQKTVSPFLEWRLEDSKPCPNFNGGCVKYPLKFLKDIDTDLGLNFTARIYAYNNAGHFAIAETDTFKIPSRYPPGLAAVKDIDPEDNTTTFYKDADVHFTANTVCAHWLGFKHHENVTIEIGIGISKTAARLLPFQQTNASNTACITSNLIHFNTKYFFFLRASCSGGKTVSVSNGIVIVNETHFLKMFDTHVGGFSEKILWTWIKTIQTKFCPTKSISIGQNYKLILENIDRTVSVFPNGTMLINNGKFDPAATNMEMNVIPLTDCPCITINLPLRSNNTPTVYTYSAVKSTTNDIKTFIKKNKVISIRWTYVKYNEILKHLTFELALAKLDKQENGSRYREVTAFMKADEQSHHSMQSTTLSQNEVYVMAIKPCTASRCIGPIYSREFEIENSISIGTLQSSHIELDNRKHCVGVDLSWRKFEAKSNVTIYQWSVSKDKEAFTILTQWKTIQADGRDNYKVSECITLPVLGHSTLYLCVKAYSFAGNVVTTCKRPSVVQTGELSKATVYDIDVAIDSWNEIKKIIHSSNIGSKYSLLHDAELDFGTTNTSVAGTLMYATERNVTWYLMKSQHLPVAYNCDKDSDCFISITTDTGYVLFDKNVVKENIFYYTCAYSNTTQVSRELFSEVLMEIGSCSNGFIIDDSPPNGGHVNVENTEGFITSGTEMDISWNGFDDDVNAVELGYFERIQYYSYAIGTRPGGEDISNYTVVGNIQRVIYRHHGIADGTGVYVSVKATNHAGLSREVYSDGLSIDATAPTLGAITINGNSSYISSSTCELIISGFKDDQSGVDHFQVGIGSKKDLEDIIRPRIRYSGDRIDLKLLADLPDGHQYFTFVKAVNRAGLSSSPVTASFILDRSAPTGGHVLDGNWNNEKDMDFQRDLDYIQGHWKGFTDTHSGIKYYRACLGTRPQECDSEAMVDVGLKTDITWNGTYDIGKQYYITVEACNAAGLCRLVSSDGLVLDNSLPIHGIVKVGSREQHQAYLPNGASLELNWVGFADPQSGIDHYEYCIGTKALLCDITVYTSCLLESSIIKTRLNLTHGKNYYVSVKAFNKAGLSVETTSDVFTIDDTPPVLVQKPAFLLDYNTITGENAQWDKSVLRISWKFEDTESKIATHTITLKTHHEGHTPVERIHIGNVDKLTIGLDDKKWLNNGDKYFIEVTSCNTAGLCSTSKSDRLLIDSSPPHQGGFKPPLIWQNFVDTFNATKSRLIISWYGFADSESAIDLYYITVSRTYTGQELSGGSVSRFADKNKINQNATITLSDALVPGELLILSIWAKNSAGLNSSVSRISVNVLSSQKSNLHDATGVLEIQKHSCDIHFCNKDCTCAVVGRPCVDVSTNDSCTTLNVTAVHEMNLPNITVFGGLLSNPQIITASSACLSGHWVVQGDENVIQRYEWSMGMTDQPVGEGIFDLKSEMPWKDIGKRKETVYCLSQLPGLQHDTDYQIYVRAWYSKNMFAEYTSAPIHVDQTPPNHARGKYIKDSDPTCSKDYDVINWMDTISACWDQVFTERQGEIMYYFVSLGTTLNGSDMYQRINVGLQTNVTLTNLSLSHGTRYYVTVTAYNNVGLHNTLSSDGFVVDMDTPISGVVFNTGKHTDTTYQSSSSTFSISWHGFIDHFSGIKSYHVALVENSQLRFENVSFTNVGLQTKHAFRHLSLTHGKSYKGLVKAVDNTGHMSDVAISSKKIVDITAPEPFHCREFQSAKISVIAHHAPDRVSFHQNLTLNNYYVIRGVLGGVYTDVTPVLSIGRYLMPLPVALDNNGTVEFEYSFLSPISGETMFSISAFEPYNSEKNFSVHVEMLVCTSAMATTDKLKAVVLRQTGPSTLAVAIKIMDRESSLYKVELGAGTTPSGFQLRPLKVIYGGTSGVIDIDTEHGSQIYVTVVAENHAGLRSAFTAAPVVIDKTPPWISEIESNIANDIHNINESTMALSIEAKWNVSDQESGIKYCFCGIGKLKDSADLEKLRLSDTAQSCMFRHLHLQHGNTIFVTVRCINTVELAREMVSKKITISTEAPKAVHATIRFMAAGTGQMQPFQPPLNMSDPIVGTLIQTDRSKLLIEWSGFEDMSGIEYYEFRLLCKNETVVGWKNSGKNTVVELTGLGLISGNRYLAEVRAVNSRRFTSHHVAAAVIIHSNEPKLTGKPLSVSRNKHHFRLDWSDVFHLANGLVATYDVTIGSRQGYSDILELQHIQMTLYDVTVPLTTLVTPSVQEMFITITRSYPSGLYTVYQTTYRI